VDRPTGEPAAGPWRPAALQALAERRGIVRDIEQGVNGGPQQAAESWHAWMAEELTFLRRQRPWRRAGVTVNGTPGRDVPPGHVLVAEPPGSSWSRKTDGARSVAQDRRRPVSRAGPTAPGQSRRTDGARRAMPDATTKPATASASVTVQVRSHVAAAWATAATTGGPAN